MEGTRVRRLEERDIDAAIALTDLESWGYTRADFRRLLDLSPEGCFAAERGGRVVGVLTTTTYDSLAFLGAVIVTPELRGKGVGKQMMEAALRHLKRSGVRSVRLYAYLNAVHFYERLGFHGEYEVVRWHGPAVDGARFRGIRPVRRADLDGIARIDAKYFGAARRGMIARFADEFSSTFLVAERAGRLEGFIVGNPSGASCEIGPWVVEPKSRATARDLYASLIGAAGITEVAFSGPSSNSALLEFVGKGPFTEDLRALRMWWGTDDFSGDPRGIWAFAGLEKG
jgi:ribosomal protein S18 acetylase RimI-like enzyme